MTPASVIEEVRRLVQDTRVPYRYSDAVLLGFVNQTLKRIAILRPDLFSYIGELPTTANSVLQTLPSDSARLVEIFQVKDANAVTEVTRDVLDQSTPGWVGETAGTPVNFMRHVRNPNKFFLYPRPASGTVLIGEYIQSPPTYTINQTVGLLPDAYFPVVVDGTVFLAESVDNEHVNSGRAKMFQESFTQALGVSLQSRVVTDTESAGLDEKQVV
jgi:hypothetical protein